MGKNINKITKQALEHNLTLEAIHFLKNVKIKSIKLQRVDDNYSLFNADAIVDTNMGSYTVLVYDASNFLDEQKTSSYSIILTKLVDAYFERHYGCKFKKLLPKYIWDDIKKYNVSIDSIRYTIYDAMIYHGVSLLPLTISKSMKGMVDKQSAARIVEDIIIQKIVDEVSVLLE